MRGIYILFLAFLVVSCQPQEPNAIKLYQKAKAKDTHLLEEKFEQYISQEKEAEKTTLAANSATAKKALNAALQPLEKSIGDSIVSATIPKNAAIQINVRDYQEVYSRINKLKEKFQFDITTEIESTTDFNKENTIKIVASPTQFKMIMNELRDMATIIRKKHIWQQKAGVGYLELTTTINSQKKAILQLQKQLETTSNTAEKLLIQDKINQLDQKLNLQILAAQNLIIEQPQSVITLSIFQNLDRVKPSPKPFNASFTANLDLGWSNFKVFLLQAALLWPYILIALLFFITILLAINNSKRQQRKFRLQTLQAQQANIQKTSK